LKNTNQEISYPRPKSSSCRFVSLAGENRAIEAYNISKNVFRKFGSFNFESCFSFALLVSMDRFIPLLVYIENFVFIFEMMQCFVSTV
jgi:hypothetical protein